MVSGSEGFARPMFDPAEILLEDLQIFEEGLFCEYFIRSAEGGEISDLDFFRR
jgi:hypothetical protein